MGGGLGVWGRLRVSMAEATRSDAAGKGASLPSGIMTTTCAPAPTSSSRRWGAWWSTEFALCTITCGASRALLWAVPGGLVVLPTQKLRSVPDGVCPAAVVAVPRVRATAHAGGARDGLWFSGVVLERRPAVACQLWPALETVAVVLQH